MIQEEIKKIKAGDIVRVYQRIKEGGKERTQVFEGTVIARKHGKEIGATITVRREISGVGVEKIFPIHSPTIEKIEILKEGKRKRAKLYYLRKE
jgi:large subunit ribosomal protein L19